jgi:hypothetical protein
MSTSHHKDAWQHTYHGLDRCDRCGRNDDEHALSEFEKLKATGKNERLSQLN